MQARNLTVFGTWLFEKFKHSPTLTPFANGTRVHRDAGHDATHPALRLETESSPLRIINPGGGDRLTTGGGFAILAAALQSFSAARENVMAKGQMRSNKEKKKPKADKNIKKGGATPSPFSSGKTPAGQSPHMNKK
jgi:hypothetical protein